MRIVATDAEIDAAREAIRGVWTDAGLVAAEGVVGGLPATP